MSEELSSAPRDGQVACGVLHTDNDGNKVPCSGYHYGTKAAGATETTDQPVPQPECVSCHGFGTGLVEDAAQRLKERVERGVGVFTNVSIEDLSVVLTALERHHSR